VNTVSIVIVLVAHHNFELTVIWFVADH